MSDGGARDEPHLATFGVSSTNAEAIVKRETASFEAFLDEFAAAFVRIRAADIDSEIENWLRRLVEFFGADRSSLAQFSLQGAFLVTHSWARPGYELSTGLREPEMPWLVAKIRRGEMTTFSSLDEIPPEAAVDLALIRRNHIKAHILSPLMLSGDAIGAHGISWMQHPRRLAPAVLQRLRLAGTVFGNALARKRAAQEQMQLSRTLEHAGRVAAISQLASSFAHEINQPLGASLTNAQTALQLLDAPNPDLAEIRAALQDIASDNRRAGEIVHELRRFLRKQEPSLAVIAISELFDAVVRFVSAEARSRGVNVSVDAADGLPEVLADRVQIQQVLVNLLLNAFDALQATSPGQRRVWLAAAPTTGNRVVVSVSDSGPGVPEHLRSTLFEPFVTTKPQGLGIGLAISQTIATAHGSRLVHSDADGGGAVFTFSLAASASKAHDG